MPKSSEQFAQSLDELALIVKTIEGADMGIVIDPQGTRMWVTGWTGDVSSPTWSSLPILPPDSALEEFADVSMPSYMPSVFAQAPYRQRRHSLPGPGPTVRSLADLARTSNSAIASDLAGGFIFPHLNNGFDAIFGAAKFIRGPRGQRWQLHSPNLCNSSLNTILLS